MNPLVLDQRDLDFIARVYSADLIPANERQDLVFDYLNRSSLPSHPRRHDNYEVNLRLAIELQNLVNGANSISGRQLSSALQASNSYFCDYHAHTLPRSEMVPQIYLEENAPIQDPNNPCRVENDHALPPPQVPESFQSHPPSNLVTQLLQTIRSHYTQAQNHDRSQGYGDPNGHTASEARHICERNAQRFADRITALFQNPSPNTNLSSDERAFLYAAIEFYRKRIEQDVHYDTREGPSSPRALIELEARDLEQTRSRFPLRFTTFQTWSNPYFANMASLVRPGSGQRHAYTNVDMAVTTNLPGRINFGLEGSLGWNRFRDNNVILLGGPSVNFLLRPETRLQVTPLAGIDVLNGPENRNLIIGLEVTLQFDSHQSICNPLSPTVLAYLYPPFASACLNDTVHMPSIPTTSAALGLRVLVDQDFANPVFMLNVSFFNLGDLFKSRIARQVGGVADAFGTGVGMLINPR
ncbi:MAG: hypothetical protein HQM15_11445 [Deltaproteobacteria bacterium]|nr:hypothetical protein [Deltaproteobacteria bacterium]